MIYHITGRAAWQAAQERGYYAAPSLDSDGFIHCARREQVLAVAADFYFGASNLLLLCIDESHLNAPLRWEGPAHPKPARASAAETVFPHIYGRLNLEAVRAAVDFPETSALPPNLP